MTTVLKNHLRDKYCAFAPLQLFENLNRYSFLQNMHRPLCLFENNFSTSSQLIATRWLVDLLKYFIHFDNLLNGTFCMSAFGSYTVLWYILIPNLLYFHSSQFWIPDIYIEHMYSISTLWLLCTFTSSLFLKLRVNLTRQRIAWTTILLFYIKT